ncbi:MAG: hypothetical protein KAQ75_13085, partial [Bacteroidales bacterium]|nr:hypothetical protein [Bacteroidales bacterium]
MTQIKIYFTILFSFLSLFIFSQDTLTLMHYNLLNYGNNFAGCIENNNHIDDKAEHLKKIIQYVHPDIFTVNEIACSTGIVDHLLQNALNIYGGNKYKKGVLSCTSLPYLANVLFYNSKKLVYYSHHAITTDIRDININTLYYYSNDLENGDTAFIHCVVAHLKAGSDADDAAQRADETSALMNYLDKNLRGNIFLLGDLNVYNSSEECFQNLVNEANPEIRFYDPIEQIGNWHNNVNYAGIHTQSTHLTDDGCPASGGMDDRFDFILFSDPLWD